MENNLNVIETHKNGYLTLRITGLDEITRNCMGEVICKLVSMVYPDEFINNNIIVNYTDVDGELFIGMDDTIVDAEGNFINKPFISEEEFNKKFDIEFEELFDKYFNQL